MAEFKFPTETVDLPSKGYFYVDGHPLSSGKVEIKYMTAKALIVDKTINIHDMVVGDKNAIMVAARILGYGKEYGFEYGGEEHEIDLSKLNPVKLDFKKMTKGVNEFSFNLPTSKRIVTFKLLNGHDENKIAIELKAREKISKIQSSELTTRLKTMLLSVDGNSDQEYINNFVETEFLSRDSLAFRKHLNEITPDMDMTTMIVDSGGKETEVTIPVTVRFFWPNT